MMSIGELIEAIAPLQRADLDVWVRDSLVAPEREGEVLRFSEMECARVRLICTLRYELEVEEDTLPLVLSLLDQLYEARGKLKALTAAVATQPRGVQDALMETMRRSREKTS
jgi:chaperone modulatory protein CbpM